MDKSVIPRTVKSPELSPALKLAAKAVPLLQVAILTSLLGILSIVISSGVSAASRLFDSELLIRLDENCWEFFKPEANLK